MSSIHSKDILDILDIFIFDPFFSDFLISRLYSSFQVEKLQKTYKNISRRMFSSILKEIRTLFTS